MLTTIRAYPAGAKNRARIVDAFGESHFFHIQDFNILERIGQEDYTRTFTPPDTLLIMIGGQYFLVVDREEDSPTAGDTVGVRVRGIPESVAPGRYIKVSMGQIVSFEKDTLLVV